MGGYKATFACIAFVCSGSSHLSRQLNAGMLNIRNYLFCYLFVYKNL